MKEVAALLLKHRISAVPVVDEAGGLVGVVSEGDLLGRNDEDRERGQEWWLTLLSKRGEIETAVTEAAVVRPALDVMHTPVVTISQDAPLHEVAEMLRIYGIKRLPAVHDGRMVGIFSRADLLRVVEGIPDAPRAMHSTDGLTGMLMSFFGGTSRGEVASGDLPARPTGPEVSAPITADMFRHLGGASDQNKIDEKKMKAHVAELQRLRQVKTMLQDHDVVQVRVTLEARKPLAGAALARSSVTRRQHFLNHAGFPCFECYPGLNHAQMLIVQKQIVIDCCRCVFFGLAGDCEFCIANRPGRVRLKRGKIGRVGYAVDLQKPVVF